MYVEVQVPLPVEGTFQYRIPGATDLSCGIRVMVDFGGRKVMGYVVKTGVAPEKGFDIKDVLSVIDTEPVFDERLLHLADHVSRSYCSTKGEVMSLALPSGQKPSNRFKNPYGSHEAHMASPLAPEQERISSRIMEQYSEGIYSHLIFGVTGSGKTHIYIDLAEKMLSQGKSVIYLVPEISLTPHIQERLAVRFKDKMVLYHSRLTPQQRLAHWKMFYSGEARIAVGTRSSIFMQCPDLGLVIIDEEHDGSYKEHSTPRYSARNLAFFRARNENALLVMGSATPSIETLYHAEQGNIRLHRMDHRYGEAVPAEVRTVCIDRSSKRSLISGSLKLAVKQTIDRNEQVILLLNRRGFAPVMMCNVCGHVIECPNCNISMNYHQGNRLVCHYCDYTSHVPEKCPECGGEEFLALGSGTQRIEEEIEREFSDYRVFRLDMDSARKKGTVSELMSKMSKGEIDILLGTQLVAKGFDFHNITLVGVLNADIGLHMPDFRAGERVFSLLTQVAGRTGRGNKPGKVILQTMDESQEIFQHIKCHDYYSYYRQELTLRKALKYPPFTRICRIVARGKEISQCKELMDRVYEILNRERDALNAEIELLGPTEAPIKKIGGNYRFHIVIKSNNGDAIRHCVRAIQREVKKKDVYLEFDLDPCDML